MADHFPPLPNADALIPTRRGKFIDIEVYGNVNATSGTLGDLQITGNVTIAPGGSLQVENVYSTNWDGAVPADLSSPDLSASVGYYLDASSGFSQFMGGMFIGGDVTLLGSGSFTTAPQGQDRLVLNTSGLSFIDHNDILVSSLALNPYSAWAELTGTLSVTGGILGGPWVTSMEFSSMGDEPFIAHKKSPGGFMMGLKVEQDLSNVVVGDYISTGSSWDYKARVLFTPDEHGVFGWVEMIRFEGHIYDDRQAFYGGGVSGVIFPRDAITLAGLFISDGSATDPSLAFSNDDDTGIFLPTANAIGFVTNGVHRVSIDNGGLKLPDGTEAKPALTFATDDTTGIYLSGAGSLRFSTNGTRRLVIHNNGWIYTGGANYSAQIRTTPGGGNVPVYAFQGLTGSGMFHNATGSGYVGLSHNANTILAGNGSNELYLGGMVAGAGSGALRYSGSQILYLASSERFKKNIEQVTFDDDDLALIDSWRSYRFRFRDSADDNVHLFTVAERVQETFGDDYVLRDDDGQVANVDDNALFTLMMETIKDLRRRVTELEGKIIGNN